MVFRDWKALHNQAIEPQAAKRCRARRAPPTSSSRTLGLKIIQQPDDRAVRRDCREQGWFGWYHGSGAGRCFEFSKNRWPFTSRCQPPREDPDESAPQHSINRNEATHCEMTTPNTPSKPDPHDSHQQPGLLDIILSVLASFFGVQSGRNQERDFRHGRAVHFIIVGLGLTLLLIMGIWIAVKFALRAAGV